MESEWQLIDLILLLEVVVIIGFLFLPAIPQFRWHSVFNILKYELSYTYWYYYEAILFPILLAFAVFPALAVIYKDVDQVKQLRRYARHAWNVELQNNINLPRAHRNLYATALAFFLWLVWWQLRSVLSQLVEQHVAMKQVRADKNKLRLERDAAMEQVRITTRLSEELLRGQSAINMAKSAWEAATTLMKQDAHNNDQHQCQGSGQETHGHRQSSFLAHEDQPTPDHTNSRPIKPDPAQPDLPPAYQYRDPHPAGPGIPLAPSNPPHLGNADPVNPRFPSAPPLTDLPQPLDPHLHPVMFHPDLSWSRDVIYNRTGEDMG